MVIDLGNRHASFQFLIRDRDAKFNTAIDPMLLAAGAEVAKIPLRMPGQNCYAEPFVGSTRECTNHILISKREARRTVG
jgi:putative transposase